MKGLAQLFVYVTLFDLEMGSTSLQFDSIINDPQTNTNIAIYQYYSLILYTPIKLNYIPQNERVRDELLFPAPEKAFEELGEYSYSISGVANTVVSGLIIVGLGGAMGAMLARLEDNLVY